MTEKERKYYNRIETELIGQKVAEVYYEEINYETDNSNFWELASDIHSVDMNIILQMESGKLIQIFWDNEFYCYGIGFTVLDKLKKGKEGIKISNVTKNTNWKKLIGKEISGIRILWDISEGITTEYEKNRIVKSENTITKLPQTWELSFDENKVWIATLEIRENESDNYYWADHLSIFFSKKGEEKYKLCKNASSQHSI
jgi:hypothetical protein